MNDTDVVQIAMAFNDKFFMPAYVMLFSVFENTKRKIHLHLLYHSLSEENRQSIYKLVESNQSEYNEYLIDDELFENASLAKNELYSIEIYYRILLPYLVQVDKILWMDADMIVKDDIGRIFDTHIEKYYLGACLDIGEDSGRRDEIKKKMGMEEQAYFNSGLLLLNCTLIREEIPAEVFFSVITQYDRDLICPDQDVLNCVIGKKLYLLDSKFNNQYHSDYRKIDTCSEASIIHFIYKKPWNDDYYGTQDTLFWEYAVRCGYRKEARAYFRSRRKAVWKERIETFKHKFQREVYP